VAMLTIRAAEERAPARIDRSQLEQLAYWPMIIASFACVMYVTIISSNHW
jgi:hypothetical protein